MLPPLQPGSSIMPGKVNPVIPEAVTMACAQVMGNDVTISVAGQSGNFQLNVMLPVIAYNLLQSIKLLGNSATVLAQKAIAGFSVDREKLAEQLDRNPMLVTALNNIVGYEKSAVIAKQAYMEGKSIREIAAIVTGMRPEELERLLDPANLVRPQ
jgi:fumarate hydratase class II